MRARTLACLLSFAIACGDDAETPPGEADAARTEARADASQSARDAGNVLFDAQPADAASAQDAAVSDTPDPTTEDAGLDASTQDAAVPDAAPEDATLEAGDATVVDAKAVDATAVDAAVADAGGNDAGAIPDAPLLSSNAAFVALFADGNAFYIADTEGVKKRAANGALLASWSAARPLTSAAFDGQHLVALDGARLSTLDLDLKQVVEGTLTESCVASVLVSNNRVVCGPSADWDRIYYTYDALTGQRLAVSQPYTYNGRPMRRVPGADAFVTVTNDLSPSDFHLYNVAADGKAVFENESPYHGDFAATEVYGFDGASPRHLITNQGLLLRFTLDCGAANQCFVKDGALGTLAAGQSFALLDGAGNLIAGLVQSGSAYTPDSVPSYELQTIDVAARQVKTRKTVRLGAGLPTALRTIANRAVIVQRSDLYPPYPTQPLPPGYLVTLTDLQ